MEGFVAVLLTCISPICIIGMVCLYRFKREVLRTRFIEKALEFGKEIDTDLLFKWKQSKQNQSNGLLIWSVILATEGLAAFIALILLTTVEWASLSALLFFPGIGMLLVYLLTRKQKETGRL